MYLAKLTQYTWTKCLLEPVCWFVKQGTSEDPDEDSDWYKIDPG